MRHIRRWGAVYVLLLLFIGSWSGQFFTELIEFRNDQQAHGQEFAWVEYWPAFLASTLENWQSEWFQLVFQAVLLLGAKHWIFKVDAEDLERIEAKIDDIKDQLGLPTPPPGEEPWEHNETPKESHQKAHQKAHKEAHEDVPEKAHNEAHGEQPEGAHEEQREEEDEESR